MVEPILEGNKVQAEITHILFPKQIKYLKERKLWSVMVVHVYIQEHVSLLMGRKRELTYIVVIYVQGL